MMTNSSYVCALLLLFRVRSGSWFKYACGRVGGKGAVLALDVQALDRAVQVPTHGKFLLEDVFKWTPPGRLHGAFDLVLRCGRIVSVPFTSALLTVNLPQ